MTSKAEEYFCLPGHPYNCAQAVALGAGHAELKEQLAVCGGGRAPQGLCGALHAALLLTPEAEHERLTGEFVRQTGAMTCRAIKGGTPPTPCARCVAVAAALIDGAK